MTLSEYLETKKIKAAKFADDIGVHRTTVVRLCKGERGISWGLIQRIHAATKGKVSAKDFISQAAE